VPALTPTVLVTVAAAAVAVVGAAFALWTQHLPRMVVSLMAAVVGATGVALATGGTALALVVGVGGAGFVIPAAAAVVVVDLDGRARRTLRPWKLLLLAPLPVAAVALWPASLGLPASSALRDDSGAAALPIALFALAAALIAGQLLVRRETR
jgi:hypothetical protein